MQKSPLRRGLSQWHDCNKVIRASGVGTDGVVGTAVDYIHTVGVLVTCDRGQEVGRRGDHIVECVIDLGVTLCGPLLAALNLIVAVGGGTPLGVAYAVTYRARGSVEGYMVQHNKWLD